VLIAKIAKKFAWGLRVLDLKISNLPEFEGQCVQRTKSRHAARCEQVQGRTIIRDSNFESLTPLN
jgi:hypothetical protein